MEFKDAVSFFNNDPTYDAYTGAFLFYCHSRAQNDQTSAGATVRRRTMTTDVDTTVPTRHVVQLFGDSWLVGTSNVDGFLGEQIRRTWGLKRSTGLMVISSPAQAVAGAGGLGLHAQKEMYRDMANPRDFSDWDPLWNIYVAPTETVSRGSFLSDSDGLYRVRNLYLDVDGLRVLEADQFESDARQTAVFTSAGKPNLRTDKVESISISLPVVQTDSLKFYRYRTEVESDAKPGDRVVFVAAASIAPQPGSTFTMLNSSWRVLSSIIENDVRALRVRLA